jgi:hypothetical protein
MIFVTISPKEAAQYSYMCIRLKQMADKMSTARKTLEGFANKSFDKSFAKCVYLLTSESLQCENEILSQIDSLNCNNYETERFENKKSLMVYTINGLESLCKYFEEMYLNSYKKLLKDKHLGNPVKNLIKNHLQLFMTSLAQLRLFIDLKASAN